jgi:hypothetical protein
MRKLVARVVKRSTGVGESPPSADLGLRVTERTGVEHVLISHGDSLQYVSGTDQQGYSVSVLEPRTALKLAWWILWRWWFRGLLFGAKLSAWQWAVEAEREELDIDRRLAKIRRRGQA